MANYLLITWDEDRVEDLIIGELTEEGLIQAFLHGVAIGQSGQAVAIYRKEPLQQLFPVPEPAPSPEAMHAREER